MAANPSTSLDQMAGKKEGPVIIDMRDLYTLYYRKGQNPYPMAKTFVCKTQHLEPEKRLQKAMDVSRSHCEQITARFIRVVPFISDLSLDEQKHQDNEG